MVEFGAQSNVNTLCVCGKIVFGLPRTRGARARAGAGPTGPPPRRRRAAPRRRDERDDT